MNKARKTATATKPTVAIKPTFELSDTDLLFIEDAMRLRIREVKEMGMHHTRRANEHTLAKISNELRKRFKKQGL